MEFNIDQLINEIKTGITTITKKDASTISGFSNRQLKGIATQASLVAFGIGSGQITDATRDFFLDQLVRLVQNFVNAFVGLLITTIEKLWNAIVAIIWKTISNATGIQLEPFTAI